MRIFAALRAFVVITVILTGLAEAQVRPATPEAGGSITIAVVQDGPAATDVSVGIEAELRQLAARGVEITFLRTPELDGQWDPARVRRALESALGNDDVDFVLAVGAFASSVAGELSLPKPVVTSFVQRPDLGGFHEHESNRSGTDNLAFMELPHLVETDLSSLENVFPFPDTAHLLLPEPYASLPGVIAEVQALSQAAGVRVEIVPMGASASETLPRVPAGAVPAYVARTPRWSRAERGELFAGLTARGAGSYGLEGQADAEAGALGGREPDITQLVTRRVALNLNHLIRGGTTGELPVLLDAEPELILNGRTAAALGYLPTYDTLVTAEILHPEALRPDAQKLSFPEALLQAGEGNLFLQISQQSVQSSYHAWKLARSPLLPQAYAGVSTFGRNARGLEGLIPTKVFNGGFSVRQMIYDDARVTDYKSEGRRYESSQQALEIDRLDVYADAGSAFLNVVLAEILLRVDADNLQLTRDNLELAKVRLDAGYSGLDEVYRWESELGSRQSILFSSRSDIEVERVALNRVLGLDQYTRWELEEVEVDPAVFPFLDGGLGDTLRDPLKMERFRDFLVRYALERSPELVFLQRSLEAQQLQLDQRQRRWYLPIFDTGFQWKYDMWRSPELPDFERDDWMWDVTAAYPLFEGGRRAEDVKLNTSEVARIEKQMIDTRQAIEREVRTAVRSIEGSFPSIGFLNQAAESARLNFEIVQDRYTEGLVNVTDLLDAQNDRFRTERTARAAQYAFLFDLVALQRAIAWFEELRPPEERDALLARVRAYMDNPTPAPEDGDTSLENLDNLDDLFMGRER